MRFAYHFVEPDEGWNKVEETVIAALIQVPRPSMNAVVRVGSLLVGPYASTDEGALSLVRRILGIELGLWSTIVVSPEEFSHRLQHDRIAVIDVSGLSMVEALRLCATLARSDTGLVGVQQLDPRVDLHWALYDQSLPLRYRVLHNQLRLLHSSTAPEDRDSALMVHWQQSALVPEVHWEDLGPRQTIFDSFDTLETAQRRAKTTALASELVEEVCDEVVNRCSDLDPNLVNALHAALDTLSRSATTEELAQAALSCRRFLERLADRLFPPSDSPWKGRKVGKAEWKNRLWAYVEQALESASAETGERLDDLGNRIDQLKDAADRGVHHPEIGRAVVHRLVVGMLTLVYDILVLAPPPARLPDDAYNAGVLRSLRDMLRHGASDTEQET